MKYNMELKYSNYVAFIHFHSITVNNSGLLMFFTGFTRFSAEIQKANQTGSAVSTNSIDELYERGIRAGATGGKLLGTGGTGGELKEKVDVAIVVKEKETYKIQELHLPVYHTLCLMLEEAFFD